LAGTSRKLVAVGTLRLASMLAAIRAATPRIGSPGSSLAVEAAARVDGVGDGAEPVGVAGAGTTAAATGVGLDESTSVAAPGASSAIGPVPVPLVVPPLVVAPLANTACHSVGTDLGLARNCIRSSSINQSFGPEDAWVGWSDTFESYKMHGAALVGRTETFVAIPR
jgi:hypothetical protein